MRSPGPPFVDIEKTYARRGPMQQYRLRTNISFRCMRCGRVKTAKLVCLYGGDPERRICNACHGRLLSIHEIKSGTLPDDARAAALADLLVTFVSEADARDAARRGKLRADYESVLDPVSVVFIGTSFQVAISFGDLDLDWSAAIIGLCKAVELELVARLIDPLRATANALTDTDRSDPELARLVAYLSHSGRSRPPEMGWIAQFLLTATRSEQRAATSGLIQSFRARVQRMPGHLWLTSGEASAAVSGLTRDFRNPASHTGTFARTDYERCRTAVVGQDGVLWALVDATTP